jgi:hypothetical protein
MFAYIENGGRCDGEMSNRPPLPKSPGIDDLIHMLVIKNHKRTTYILAKHQKLLEKIPFVNGGLSLLLIRMISAG